MRSGSAYEIPSHAIAAHFREKWKRERKSAGVLDCEIVHTSTVRAITFWTLRAAEPDREMVQRSRALGSAVTLR